MKKREGARKRAPSEKPRENLQTECPEHGDADIGPDCRGCVAAFKNRDKLRAERDKAANEQSRLRMLARRRLADRDYVNISDLFPADFDQMPVGERNRWIAELGDPEDIREPALLA